MDPQTLDDALKLLDDPLRRPQAAPPLPADPALPPQAEPAKPVAPELPPSPKPSPPPVVPPAAAPRPDAALPNVPGISVDDDATPTDEAYRRLLREAETREALDWLNSMVPPQPGASAPQTLIPGQAPGETTATEYDLQSGQETRELPSLLQVGRAIVRGIPEIPSALAQAPGEAVQAALNLAEYISRQMPEFLQGGVQLFDREGNLDIRLLSGQERAQKLQSGELKPLELPEVFPEPETTVGQLTKVLGQFLVGFAAAGRAFSALNIPKAASTPGMITQDFAKAFVTDFAAFDGLEGNLFNLLETFPSLKGPVTDFLAASPDNTEVENRLKNAVAGLGLGAMFSGLLVALRGMREARRIKELTGAPTYAEAAEKLMRDMQSGAVKPELSTMEGFLGAPDDPLVAWASSLPKTEFPVPDDVVAKGIEGSARDAERLGFAPEGQPRRTGAAPAAETSAAPAPRAAEASPPPPDPITTAVREAVEPILPPEVKVQVVDRIEAPRTTAFARSVTDALRTGDERVLIRDLYDEMQKRGYTGDYATFQQDLQRAARAGQIELERYDLSPPSDPALRARIEASRTPFGRDERHYVVRRGDLFETSEKYAIMRRGGDGDGRGVRSAANQGPEAHGKPVPDPAGDGPIPNRIAGSDMGEGAARREQKPTRPFSVAGLADGLRPVVRYVDPPNSALKRREYAIYDDKNNRVAYMLVRPATRNRIFVYDVYAPGMGKMLYDAVELDMGGRIMPSGTITERAYKFWLKRDADAVKWHQRSLTPQGEVEFVSPRELLLRIQDEVATESDLALWRNLPDEAKRAAEDPDALFALAYHGSPHDFDRFDMSKVGTGEGHQTFGYGLYFAENKTVADKYRVELSGGSAASDRGLVGAELYDASNPVHIAARYLFQAGSRDEAVAQLKAARSKYTGIVASRIGRAIEVLESGRDLPEYTGTGRGRLYEVEIDVNDKNLLDYDRPIGEQDLPVASLAKLLGRSQDDVRQMTGKVYQEELRKKIFAAGTEKAGGQMDGARKHVEKQVSEELLRVGVKGIRYLDQVSRISGEGTRNLVIFDDSLIKIVAKDGKPVSPDERAAVLALSQDALRVEGRFSPNDLLIEVSRMAFDPVGVARHESIHALRALGLFTDKEWQTLARTARKERWAETTGVDERYRGVYGADADDKLLEEAIAWKFKDWMQGRGTVDPQTVTLFERIKQFLARLANALRGQGFQTADDVFERVRSGEVKGRGASMPAPDDPRLSAAPRAPDATNAAAPHLLSIDTPRGTLYVNWARIDSHDGLKQVLADAAYAYQDDILAAQGGVKTHAMTRASADQIDAWNVLLGERGNPLPDAAETLALRDLYIASGQKLREVAQQVIASPTLERQFALRKMMAVHQAIQAQVFGIRTAQAQALNQWRIAARGERERMRAMEQILREHGGNQVTLDIAAKLDALAKSGNQTAIDKFTRKSAFASTLDAVREYYMGALLSGPKTHLVNALSNTSVVLLSMAERAVAGQLSHILSPVDGVRVGEATAMMWGIRQSLKEAFILAGKTFRTGQQGQYSGIIEGPRLGALSSEALSTTTNPVFNRLMSRQPLGRAIDMLGTMVRIPGRALAASDEFFKTINYRAELWAQAFRQAMQEIDRGKLQPEQFKERMVTLVEEAPEQLRLKAIDMAAYNTFTNDPGPFVNSVMRLRDHLGPLGWLILPFVRTPANILAYTFERTPLAPLSARIRADIAAGGERQALALARIGLGTMIMGVAYEMALDGTITGSGPKKPQERQALLRTGWQPYSVRVRDGQRDDGTPQYRYYAFNRLDPLGFTLGIAGDFGEYMLNADETSFDPDWEEIWAAAAASAADNLLDKSYLRSFSSLMAAINDHDVRAERVIVDILGSFIPVAVKDVAQFQDPHAKYIANTMDKLKSRLPGYSKEVPNRVDLWGRDISFRSGLGQAYDMVSPIYSRQHKPEPADQEMLRLKLYPVQMTAVQIKRSDVSKSDSRHVSLRNMPHALRRYHILSGGTPANQLPWDHLNRSQRRILSLAGSRTPLEFINDIVTGKDRRAVDDGKPYAELTDEEKRDWLQSVFSAWRAAAKPVLLKEFPRIQELRDRMQER